MYQDIGGKIKKIAVYIAVIGVFVGVFILAISLHFYISEAQYLKYAAALGTEGRGHDSLLEAGNKAYAGLRGITLSIPLIIISLISSWPLYGFGQLIEDTSENLKYQKENNKILTYWLSKQIN